MIKAVFFDVDGTLVSFKTHKIPVSTELAIKRLKENGIKVFISTGRSINFIDDIKYLDFDGYVTFNGGYCVTKDEAVIFKQYLNKADIEALIDYAENIEPVNFAFMAENKISISKVTPELEKVYQILNLERPEIEDYVNFNPASILQVNLFVATDKETQLMQEVMVNSSSSRWSPLFIDVNPVGQSKKNGLDVFLKHFNIDWSESMSFGDGGNDLEMLKATAIGVAMGNANPEVKAIADYVTNDVDEDGIYNALKHFKLI